MTSIDDDDLNTIDQRLRLAVQSLDRFHQECGQGRLDRMINTAFRKEEKRLRRELNSLVKSSLKQGLVALGGGTSSSSVIDAIFGFIPGFARGGVLSRKTRLAYGGEAGPEAVLPLKRGADGRLEVVAQNKGGSGRSHMLSDRTPIHITITHPQPVLQQAINAGDMDAVEAALSREIDQAIDTRLRAHLDGGGMLGKSSGSMFR